MNDYRWIDQAKDMSPLMKTALRRVYQATLKPDSETIARLGFLRLYHNVHSRTIEALVRRGYLETFLAPSGIHYRPIDWEKFYIGKLFERKEWLIRVKQTCVVYTAKSFPFAITIYRYAAKITVLEQTLDFEDITTLKDILRLAIATKNVYRQTRGK